MSINTIRPVSHFSQLYLRTNLILKTKLISLRKFWTWLTVTQMSSYDHVIYPINNIGILRLSIIQEIDGTLCIVRKVNKAQSNLLCHFLTFSFLEKLKTRELSTEVLWKQHNYWVLTQVFAVRKVRKIAQKMHRKCSTFLHFTANTLHLFRSLWAFS